MNQFVHLHLHTEFSLLDGACRIKKLPNKINDLNMHAVAMTDHGNISGAVNFYSACKAADIKPIIGCELYVAPGSREERSRSKGRTSHLTVLAKNNQGYKNLMKLVSAGYLEGFYYKPRVDKELLSQHSEGLICLSGCARGEVSFNLVNDSYNAALKAADEYAKIFKDHYYLELMDHNLPEQQKILNGLVKISQELNLPVVATNDVHYIDQNESPAHELLLCIQTQTTVNDPKRIRFNTDQLYLKSPEQMQELFGHIPGAIENTVKIADMCDVTLDFDTYHLPKFHTPEGLTDEQYLRQLCDEGLKKRYPKVDGQLKDELDKRLEHELATIENMGFVSYFLITQDFINYAKDKDIPVGPGRGSAAGSLVSYLIGITDLDPLKYGLLFERFLNPSRAGMPDIDIDFCYERRPEVIDRVTEQYGGKENVAQIITFGTMQAKAAIRDVGRAMGMSYGDVDAIAKLIPNELGITLEQSLETEPRLRQLIEEDPQANKLMQTARTLEGLNRHASTHAAGVVVLDKKLSDYCPLYMTSDGQVSTGFTMDGVAKIGLLKMDFLGLRTLTVIHDAIKLIKKHKGVDVSFEGSDFVDDPTYEMLGRGRSLGVFQLESGGMRELLKKSKPSVFEDIVAILALYRPGPMGSGMLDDYILRKKGEAKVKYPHPKLEPVLKDSYGIILYQEQVMQIPVALAGFDMTRADNLRRAMSKKITKVMDEMRELFVNGCKEHSDMSEKDSNQLFDLIDYFSGYGFNKSHSAAYAVITFQTAYLKANYPTEFMCSLITSERDNTDKVVEYIKECEAMGITILPPNVNQGYKEFTVVDENTLAYGLLAVKGIGAGAIDSVSKEREENGPYTSIYDFCKRVDLRLNNKRVLESLIKSGAFDSISPNRAQLFAVLDAALSQGSKQQKEQASGQMSFFDMGGDDQNDAFGSGMEKLPDVAEWPESQILANEKSLLGHYISGHPLSRYSSEVKHFTEYDTKRVASCSDGQGVRLVGMLSYIKMATTKRTGERMAITHLEDLSGEIEAVIFPKAFRKVVDYVKTGNIIIVEGTVSLRDGQAKLIIEDIQDISQLYHKIREIRVDLSEIGQPGLEKLKGKLERFPGSVPVYLQLSTDDYQSVEIKVGKSLHVSPSEVLMDEIKQMVGEERFKIRV